MLIFGNNATNNEMIKCYFLPFVFCLTQRTSSNHMPESAPSTSKTEGSDDDAPTAGSRKRVSFCPTVEDNERPTGQSLEERRLEEKMSHSLHKLAADAIVKYLTPHYKEGRFSSKVGLFIHHNLM